VVEDFALTSPKTKLLAQKVKEMGLTNVLIITDKLDENLLLSSRNLSNILVIEPRHADPVSLLRFDNTLITKGAVAKIEEMLA
jgi:large subunit ribosomal protein L4